MATDSDTSVQDMKSHEKTYSKVIGMLKWGAVACFILAFAVIFLISSY